MNAHIQLYFEDNLPEELSYLKSAFTGKAKELYTLYMPNEKAQLLVGLGKKEELTSEIVRNVMGKVARKAKELEMTHVELELPALEVLTEEQMAIAMVEGMELGLYAFDKYKTDRKEGKSFTYELKGAQAPELIKDIIDERKALASSINFARDLINEPSNVLYPETLAAFTQEEAEKCGLEIEVLEGEALEQLHMNGMLTVGNGSVHKPRLIVLRHKQGEDAETFGLVGKGLTCDTGGYSLKANDSMYYQKTDMSGAASVIGTMLALAKNNVPVNVTAVIPACENVVSGESYKVGDVITMMSGKTVQVLNTDAEGRIALGDALTYIVREEKVSKVLDLATLTGVAGITFGNVYTAAVSNNDTFYNTFQTAADQAEELFWRLPTHARYREWINSDVADLKNTGAAGGGTITAALFLQEFVEDRPWIHLDIAATACVDPAVRDYEYRGGTGVAIRTLYQMIKAGV